MNKLAFFCLVLLHSLYCQEIILKDSLVLPINYPKFLDESRLFFIDSITYVAIYHYNEIANFYKVFNQGISLVEYKGKPIFKSNSSIKYITSNEQKILLFCRNQWLEFNQNFEITKIRKHKYPFCDDISIYQNKLAIINSKNSKPYQNLVLLDISNHKPKQICKTKIQHTISLSLINGFYGMPSVQVSILNDTIISINYVFSPINFIYFIPKNKFTYFVINPLEENKERKFFIEGKRWYGVTGMIKNTCIATHYDKLISFKHNNQDFLYQLVKFPISLDDVLDEKKFQENLKQKVVIWDKNFQYLASIEIKNGELFQCISNGTIYTYKKQNNKFVVYKYFLQNFNTN